MDKFYDYEHEVEKLSAMLPKVNEDRFYGLYDSVEESACDMMCNNESYNIQEPYSDEMYASVTQTFKGWQVFRTFQLRFRKKSSMSYMRFSYNEVAQEWRSLDGKVVRFKARMYNKQYDMWNLKSKMKLTRDFVNPLSSYNYIVDSPSIFFDNIDYSMLSIINEYYHGGYDTEYGLKDCNFYLDFVTSELGEFLYKCGYRTLFDSVLAGKVKTSMVERMNKYFNIVKIAHRHKYDFTQDLSLWLDTIKFIELCNGDIHQPNFICPKDLTAEHNKWFNRYERNKSKMERKRLMEQAKIHDPEYIKNMGKYMGVVFQKVVKDTDIKLEFRALTSATQLADEGYRMKHCVGTYWDVFDSLIITCHKVGESNSIATIEIDLNNFSIVQNRGVCNHVPEYFDDINSAIMENIGIIKEAKKAA